MDTRFRSSDWFVAIGGLLVLVGSLLPWWTMRFDGALAVSQNGYDFDLTGLVPIAVMLVVAAATVIVKTGSLPLPGWIVHPYLVALAVAVATVGIGVRFVWSGYEDVGRVTRGVGIFLALAGVLVACVGCVLAIRDLRRPPTPVLDDVDDLDDDEEEDDGVDRPYGYGDTGDVDELVRPADGTAPATPAPTTLPARTTPPRRSVPRETTRRRSSVVRETPPSTRRRRPQTGPPPS